MSALDVLVDVIETIHQAEKSLGPGEVPSSAVFKHVRTLWQLLLGIRESIFDSHNYELFELHFKDTEKIFTGFRYFGLDKDSVALNLHNGVGSTQESSKIVDLLEEASDEGSETSISFKLSILNKVRYILFCHAVRLKEILDETKLLRAIESYMRNDILNTSNQISVTLETNNPTFDSCYKLCLEESLLQPLEISIAELSQRTLETFKLSSDTAFFFDCDLLFRFHNEMVGLLKHVFRKHDYINIEIDDYFRHNPILPILKPIYRKLEIRDIHEETQDRLSQSDAFKEEERAPLITDQILVQTLKDISSLSVDSSKLKVPLDVFSQIIRIYCNLITKDGIDSEDDTFVFALKKCIFQWTENLINDEEFIKQISELSLIPFAAQYKYGDDILPNLNMRMAVFLVGQNLRLRELYFSRWKNNTARNELFTEKLNQWKERMLGKVLERWKCKANTIINLAYIDTAELDVLRIRSAFIKLVEKYQLFQHNHQKAETVFIRKYFRTWKLKLRQCAREKQDADEFYRKNTLKLYMSLWVSAKANNFSKTTVEFQFFQKKIYFNFWCGLMGTQNKMYKTAERTYDATLLRYGFLRWKERSKKPLLKLNTLETLAKKYCLQKYFDKMKLVQKLAQLESQVVLYTEREITRRYFQRWHKFKLLTDSENMLYQLNRHNIMKAFFCQWSATHKMTDNARQFYRKNSMSSAFKIWKLELTKRRVECFHDATQLKKVLDVWKLKLQENKYNKRKSYVLMRGAFLKWFGKSSSIKERLEDCESAFQIIRLTTYFGFWQKQKKQNIKLNNIATSYNSERNERKDRFLKIWALEKMKLRLRNCRTRDKQLKHREGSFKKNILQFHFNRWKNKNLDYQYIGRRADEFYYSTIISRYFEIWLHRSDQVLSLDDKLQETLENNKFQRMMEVFTKMRLRLMKSQSDEANAMRFKERWDRMRLKAHLDIWKLKKSKRTSPTPTARGRRVHSTNEKLQLDLIPELNPYYVSTAKGNGSPILKPPIPSRMESILTRRDSQYEISGSAFRMNQELQTPTNDSYKGSSLSFRTPGLRRNNSRILTSSKLSPSKNNVSTASTDRIRMKNAEERMNRYSLLRSPPRTIPLQRVDEQEHNTMDRDGDDGNIFKDEGVFDTTTETMIDGSTPISERALRTRT